ncbi:hypothetical protein GCM10027578_05720 [Spirosoma luteolum]
MKTTLIATLLLSLRLFLPGFAQHQPTGAQSKKSQPVEVLMIGTSHGYGKKPVEHFDSLITTALAFRPDAVFGEWLSAEDYNAIPDYWNKANVERRLAYLKGLPNNDPKSPASFIRKTYALLRQHPNYHQERMKLARALYLNHDFGDAAYQLYRLDRARPAFGAEEVAAYRTILGVPDSLYRNRTNEYHNILFPLLDQLKQDRMRPMDSQRHDRAWQQAWNRADSLVHRWENTLDSNSADGRRYAALMQRTQALSVLEQKASKAGNGTLFFNSPEGDEYLNILNFYGGRRMYGAAGFPEKELEAMLDYFRLRNVDMCTNLVDRARAAGARRVVVGVGANHRKIMVDILRTMPGVTVTELTGYGVR